MKTETIYTTGNKKAVDLSPNVPTASYQIPTKGNVYNEQ
ncbi:unnamed protein product [Commensalibacter communis]|nr:unnamed protein product [Commensalibacter communis]